MISLTRLNGQSLVVNEDVIKWIETTPDTVLTLTTGDKLLVKESAEVVIEKCLVFKARVFYDGPQRQVAAPVSEREPGGHAAESDMLQ